MIDKKTLDAVLPVPSLEELRDAKVEELKNEGFVITNFHSGGVFHTMLMIALRIKIEVIELLRLVLNNMFVSHATGIWLDLKMADYSKKRKRAQKARGLVTVTRLVMGAGRGPRAMSPRARLPPPSPISERWRSATARTG